MILQASLFDFVTIILMVVCGTIVLLIHVWKKIMTRKIFFIVEAFISVIACVTIGLYDHLNGLKIVVATAVITSIMMIGWAIAVHSFEYIDKIIKNASKHNKNGK